MAPVHRVAQSGRFWMTIPRGLLLSMLIYSAVSGIRCPEEAPSLGDCIYVFRSVTKGESVNISLDTSQSTLDLCKQNGTTSKWDPVYSFFKENPMKLSSDFQEQVAVSHGTFMVKNVSQGADGNYVFQDSDGKCLAHITLTVGSSGSGTQSSAHQKGVTAAWYWCMFPLLCLLQWL